MFGKLEASRVDGESAALGRGCIRIQLGVAGKGGGEAVDVVPAGGSGEGGEGGDAGGVPQQTGGGGVWQ